MLQEVTTKNSNILYEIPYKTNEKGVIEYNSKHKQIIKSILDPNIWFVNIEGAKRASKDVFGLAGYAKLLDRHPAKFHLTLGTNRTNAIQLIIDADGFGLQQHFPQGEMGYYHDKKAFIFTDKKGRKKYVICAGADKENSYKGFRGPNYGTVYMCEANLFHLNSLNEAKDRTMSSPMPKIIATYNPDNPNAQFYIKFERSWQDKTQGKYKNENPNGVWNGPDMVYIHLTQSDNPSMTQKRLDRNLRSYGSEVEKDRNFYGLRRASGGLIYDMITADNYYEFILPKKYRYAMDRYLIIDEGSSNPFVILECFVDKEMTLWFEDEERWTPSARNKQITQSEKVEIIKKVIGDESYVCVIVDPSATSLKAEMETNGIYYENADNTVLGTTKQKEDAASETENVTNEKVGIHLTQDGFKMLKIKINKLNLSGKSYRLDNGNLVDEIGAINELNAYRWDDKAREKSGKDTPKKVDDHAPDCIRYAVNTIIKEKYIWMQYI